MNGTGSDGPRRGRNASGKSQSALLCMPRRSRSIGSSCKIAASALKHVRATEPVALHGASIVANQDTPQPPKTPIERFHRLFGLSWTDFFRGTDVAVETEFDLSTKQQFLDVVII